jgi:hypothetical protein
VVVYQFLAILGRIPQLTLGGGRNHIQFILVVLLMAKKKENKDLLELGSTRRAGLILSKYLRAIACEKTEILDIPTGPDEVKHRVASKAERLAREIWNKVFNSDDKKEKLEYIKLVIERTDGKAGTVDDAFGKDEDSIPDRISEMNKKRANQIAEDVMGEDDN